MGIFIEEIGNLDRKDARNSRSNSHRTKRRRAAHVPGIRIEESEHDGGIPEDDAEFLPSSESGEDGGARCNRNSSDDFVAPRTAASKQSDLRPKTLPSRNSGNVTIKQRSAPETEPAREGAKVGKYPEGSHANLAGKVNQQGHRATNGYGMQTHTTANTDGPVENGHKGNTPLGSDKITILDVTPISSAPPLDHFMHHKVTTHTLGPAIGVPYMVTSNTPATSKSCPAPSSQKKGGTPTTLQSRKAQATQVATATIGQKL